MRKVTFLGIIAIIFTAMFSYSPVTAEESVIVNVQNEQGGDTRPDLDTAKVELTFANNQNGTAHIFLRSPERKFFSPTDFPIVEGTDLIDATLPIENGKATFQYMFPIRGDYHLKVYVMDGEGKAGGTHELVININENPAEVKNAVIFITILTAFGFAVGYLLSRRRKSVYAV
ncbi:hypothetical protein ACWKW1_25520 [Brevibacillus parabrevis]